MINEFARRSSPGGPRLGHRRDETSISATINEVLCRSSDNSVITLLPFCWPSSAVASGVAIADRLLVVREKRCAAPSAEQAPARTRNTARSPIPRPLRCVYRHTPSIARTASDSGGIRDTVELDPRQITRADLFRLPVSFPVLVYKAMCIPNSSTQKCAEAT